MAGSPVIESIRSHIERLVSENRRLKREHARIGAQRDKLLAENRGMAGQIAELEKKLAVMELREGLAGQSDQAKIARARVNRLMREVDKCIALLNR